MSSAKRALARSRCRPLVGEELCVGRGDWHRREDTRVGVDITARR